MKVTDKLTITNEDNALYKVRFNALYMLLATVLNLRYDIKKIRK